jgi:L-fucose mutarotase/ribose pyranase (RbsD/FucU family)
LVEKLKKGTLQKVSIVMATEVLAELAQLGNGDALVAGDNVRALPVR